MSLVTCCTHRSSAVAMSSTCFQHPCNFQGSLMSSYSCEPIQPLLQPNRNCAVNSQTFSFTERKSRVGYQSWEVSFSAVISNSLYFPTESKPKHTSWQFLDLQRSQGYKEGILNSYSHSDTSLLAALLCHNQVVNLKHINVLMNSA